MIDAEYVRSILDYDSENGVLVRKVRTGPKTYEGQRIDRVGSSGYVHLRINGIRFPAHRVIWLHCTGSWPEHEIDHINGVKHDNRMGNLRDVPHQVNVQNLRSSTSSSSTGLLGVGPKGKKWRARITYNGKMHYLGEYKTMDEAKAEYDAAKRIIHEGCTI